jgi:transcriptional regulator with XRE-family HTH domain
MIEIGAQIKKRREALAYSQTYIAAKTGMTQQNYSRIESGKCDPTIGTLDRIARALGCGIDDLLEARKNINEYL